MNAFSNIYYQERKTKQYFGQLSSQDSSVGSVLVLVLEGSKIGTPTRESIFVKNKYEFELIVTKLSSDVSK